MKLPRPEHLTSACATRVMTTRLAKRIASHYCCCRHCVSYDGVHGRMPSPACIMRNACTCSCPFQSASYCVRHTHRRVSASQKDLRTHAEGPEGQEHSKCVLQQCKTAMSGLLLSLAALTCTPLPTPALATEYPGLSNDVPVVRTHARHPLLYMTSASIDRDMRALHCCSGYSYTKIRKPRYTL